MIDPATLSETVLGTSTSLLASRKNALDSVRMALAPNTGLFRLELARHALESGKLDIVEPALPKGLLAPGVEHGRLYSGENAESISSSDFSAVTKAYIQQNLVNCAKRMANNRATSAL